jgi:hypothetical protein
LVRRVKTGGNEEPFYDGKLISNRGINIVNARRDAYGAVTEIGDAVSKSLERRRTE